ncbi:MAG: hypothetical protein D6731_12710 [Planctomycetota bacterium]|nr:MAG: hypothetical protein D6731_12710 [Planctomycetota bacterium]
MDYAGDVDVFAVPLSAGARYTFRTADLRDGMDTVLVLYDTNGSTQLQEDDDSGGGYASEIDFRANADGTYYLAVRHYDPGEDSGRYRLEVAGGGVAAPGDDHGDDAASATALAFGTPLAGEIERGGDEDWFAVTLSAGQAYRFRTTVHGGMDTVLVLYAPNGSTVLEENDDFGGSYASGIDATAAQDGVHYLRVTHYDDATGTGSYDVLAEQAGGAAPPAPGPAPGPASGLYTHRTVNPHGPDVYVGDLHDIARYGHENGITAFAIGTTSCNKGDQELRWFSSTNEHPVIGSNMFRLKDGRFEQVGMSWLKHGFYAMSGSLCFNDCQSTTGDYLGVHCSDPYSASLNGSQSNLGPRFDVNPATGQFPYPYTDPPIHSSTLDRRLQVRDADLDPALNQGARYFVEGHYITPDDAGPNALNNFAYREVRVTGSGGRFDIEFVPGVGTVREDAALFAWRAVDPQVVITGGAVPGDGTFDIGYKVTDNGNGTWHYEYAVHNLNSDRAARSFSIPLPPGATVTNIGFHDVDYHSGSPYDGTDWTAQVAGGAVVWETRTYAQDPNANALRWSTVYNFRFDCDRAPGDGDAVLGLFKPGAVPSLAIRLAAGVPDASGGGGSPTDTTPPTFAGASGLAASAPDALTVSWSGASDNVTPSGDLVYRVYLATNSGGQDFRQPTATTAPGALSATLSGLQPATDYYVVVRAVDAAGNEDQNTAEVQASTPPAPDVQAPSFAGAGAAQALGSASLEVTWSAASDNVSTPSEIRYRIYAALTSGGQDFQQPTATTAPGALSATLSGLQPATDYYVVVRAVDAAGNEEQNTVEVRATTQGVAGGLLAPAVEVDLRRYSNRTGAFAPGDRVGLIVSFRNTTAQDVDVSGSIDLEAPSGQRFRIVGPVNGLTIRAGRTARYLVNVIIDPGAAPGSYTVLASFRDPAGGFDLATHGFDVAAPTP